MVHALLLAHTGTGARTSVVVVCAALAPLLPWPAWATNVGFAIDSSDLVFVSGGAVFGQAVALSGDLSEGVVLGGEFSAGHLWKTMWYVGGVVDGVWDAGRHRGRTMVGPEFGYAFVGIDGGYLVEYGGGGTTHHGAAVRLLLSAIAMHLYVRYGMLVGAPDLVEFGLLLKVPWVLGP